MKRSPQGPAAASRTALAVPPGHAHADAPARPRTTQLQRAFLILGVLPVGEGMRLAEVARLADLPKPTAHRILRQLIDLGQAAQDDGGDYRSLGRFAAHADPAADAIRITALPLMRRLHRRFDETVNLGALERGRIRYLHVMETARPLRVMTSPRPTDAVHTTALGRAILGQLGPLAARALLEDRLPSAELERALASAREAARAGYAEERGETEPGVACLAVPLPGPWEARVAISITVPLVRLPRERRAEIIAALSELTK